MLKAIIADTDPSSIQYVETLLADLWPELMICGRAGSGWEALQLINAHAPQLAFLEVRLPGICGMRVARRITHKCQVVFTTSYDHYAVNAFDSGAVDYLLKPLVRDRLQKAIGRAKRHLDAALAPHGAPIGQPAPTMREPIPTEPEHYRQWICCQGVHCSKIISVDQVCYFKSDHKYTSVVTGHGKSLINKSIKALVAELNPTRFWRIHRATIINVARIESVGRSETGRATVRLKDRPERLTVSRPYLHLFKTI